MNTSEPPIKLSASAAYCGWCKDQEVAPGQKLCPGCSPCAASCGAIYPDKAPFRQAGRALYCTDCYPTAAEAAELARAAAEAARIAKAAGLSPAHRHVTLERLTPGQRETAARYMAIPAGNLLLTGAAGTGKTWTAVAILRGLMARSGASGRWLSMPWLFASIRDWMAEGPRSTFRLTQYVDEVLNHDYVVLDDLGAHRATDWAIETLYLILHRWELLDKPGGLIVTTNLELSGISDAFGDRIASRLAQGCQLVRMDGPDLRLVKRGGVPK
jgi:DNA replication protein DnaC